MGYDLHITRKENWFDEFGPEITESEWRRLIDSDPELELDTETRCEMADGEYVFAAWNGEPGVLGYYSGEITAKYPDDALMEKMVAIADQLGANVQGDDGERYPDVKKPGAVSKKPFWKRLFGSGEPAEIREPPS